ncbi:hypothetical protein QZH41_015169, partial [Actinostola sp. cb2023]
FRFRCCSGKKRYVKFGCKTTPYYQNHFHGNLNFNVPPGYYMTGLTSDHNNGQEDRRWQFEYCRIRPTRGRDEPQAKDETEPVDKDVGQDELPGL